MKTHRDETRERLRRSRGKLLAIRRGIQRAFRRSGRRGQALTEFAITVPVMVTVLLFSIFFYEINHLKLKAQEMARYAAWEFTGYPLHDYGEKKQSGKFSDAKGDVSSDFSSRFANLQSTNTRSGSKYIAVSWRDPRLQLKDEIEPKIPSGRELGLPINLNTVFNFVTMVVDIISLLRFKDPNPVLELMMGLHKIEENIIFGARASRFNPPGRWGFNKKGYVHSTVTLRYRNEFIPRSFLNRRSGMYSTSNNHNRHFMVSRFTFREKAAVVADSWRLHYGESIDNDSGSDKPYWKAVDRMAWVSKSVRDYVMKPLGITVRLLVGLICVAAGGTGYIAVPPNMDPMKNALVSKQYKGQRPSSGQVRLNEDSGSVSYDTSPNKEGSDYRKAFEKRGEHFMGCPEPESLTCGPSLSTDNPFGDFVVPPPES